VSATPRKGCARCGVDKPPWFEYCGKCYALVQLEQMARNRCHEQDCEEIIDDDHFLCRRHWQEYREGTISECPECGEYKPASFPLCRRCNAQAGNPPAREQQARRSFGAETSQRTNNTRRPYDQHDGEDDRKAKDKRYWFNRQNNGVCNYCGNRYPYDQLEMEHMIPKELGGPDHRRNMQLACKTCNQKKGTSTDIEFRTLNSRWIPMEERTPPRSPVDPGKLRAGNQGGRYRQGNRDAGQYDNRRRANATHRRRGQ